MKSHSKVITEISWAFKRRPFKSFHHDGVEIRLRLQSCRTFLSVLLMLTSNLSTLVVRRSRMSSCSSISVCIPRAMSFSRPRPTDSSSAGQESTHGPEPSHSIGTCNPRCSPHGLGSTAVTDPSFLEDRPDARALVTCSKTCASEEKAVALNRKATPPCHPPGHPLLVHGVYFRNSYRATHLSAAFEPYISSSLKLGQAQVQSGKEEDPHLETHLRYSSGFSSLYNKYFPSFKKVVKINLNSFLREINSIRTRSASSM